MLDHITCLSEAGPRVRDQRVRHCQNEAWSGLAKNRELRHGEYPGEPSSNGQAAAYDQLYKDRDFVDLFWLWQLLS